MEIILTTGWLWIIGISLLLIFIYLNDQFKTKSTEINNLKKEVSKIKTESLITFNESVNKQVEEFRIGEFERYKKITDQTSLEAASVVLQRWKIEVEQQVRKDAINRSVSVQLGKIAEHLVPFSSYMSHFNPRDIKFMGSPIDLIVFDGMSDNKPEITIHFVEVKTGTSSLSESQKKVKKAVENNNVKWLPISLGNVTINLL